jgi:hypothetical protein
MIRESNKNTHFNSIQFKFCALPHHTDKNTGPAISPLITMTTQVLELSTIFFL